MHAGLRHAVARVPGVRPFPPSASTSNTWPRHLRNRHDGLAPGRLRAPNDGRNVSGLPERDGGRRRVQRPHTRGSSCMRVSDRALQRCIVQVDEIPSLFERFAGRGQACPAICTAIHVQTSHPIGIAGAGLQPTSRARADHGVRSLRESSGFSQLNFHHWATRPRHVWRLSTCEAFLAPVGQS